MKLARLERIATQTLLGIRFWDRLIASPITDGLYVTAQRLSDDRSQRLGRAVIGRGTPSGAIAFFGLAAEEYVGDEPHQQIWATVPSNRLIAIDLIDRLGRYLPMSFVAQLPFQGAFRGRGDWLTTPLLRPIPNEGEEMGVYLWSAPTRSLPSNYAGIYAQIVVGADGELAPASHALVEVSQSMDGMTMPGTFQYFGITDSQGMLTLPLPYPPISDPDNGSYPPLEQQLFPLDITVRYNSTEQETLSHSAVPNLESIFTQSPADIGINWNTETGSVLQTSSSLRAVLRVCL